MGAFYDNIVVLDRTSDEVLAALGTTPALVALEVDRMVVVFHDDEGGDLPHVVAQSLSTSLHGRLVWFSVHDDDILSCALWHDGALVAEVSIPDPADYFDIPDEERAALAEAAADLGIPTANTEGREEFVTAVGRGDTQRAVQVLAADFVFATDRHRDLLEALKLPTFAAGWGRKYLLDNADGYNGPPLRATV